MNKAAYTGGIVRIITTLVGGWLAQKGWATEADVEGIAGAVILVATGVWSIWAKRKALKAIPPAVKAALALIVCSAFLSGCVAIRANSNGEGAQVWAVGFGSDSSSQLANVAVTGPGTEGTDAQTGVSFDAANSEQKTSQTLQSLLTLGAALAPVLSGVPAKATTSVMDTTSETDTDTAAVDTPVTEYSADGYTGTPGPEGVGVYGKPGCSNCRAYVTAHPETPLINLNDAANKAAMWTALRSRGYKGDRVELPVVITLSGWKEAAK